MRSKLTLTLLAALAFGMSVGFWRVASQNVTLSKTIVERSLASDALREENANLRHALQGVTASLKLAETRVISAESSERAAKRSLIEETRLRDVAEGEKADAIKARDDMRVQAEGATLRLRHTLTALASKARAASALNAANANLLANLRHASAQLAAAKAARVALESERDAAEEQALLLNARALEEMNAREAAEVARAGIEARLKALETQHESENSRETPAQGALGSSPNPGVGSGEGDIASGATPAGPAYAGMESISAIR